MRFTFAGTEYEGREGETLAAALVRNGVLGGFRSLYRDRPRGVYTAGEEEPNALVQIGAPADAARDARRAGGRARRRAARRQGAARRGAGRHALRHDARALRRPRRRRRPLRRRGRGSRVRPRPATSTAAQGTWVVGLYDDNYAIAVEHGRRRLADPREADRARDRRDRAAGDLPRQRPARAHARRRLRARTAAPPARRRSRAAGARASTSGARPAAACAGTTGSARPCPTASCAGSSASARLTGAGLPDAPAVRAAGRRRGRDVRRPRARLDRRRRAPRDRRRPALGRARQALHDDRHRLGAGQARERQRDPRRRGAAAGAPGELGTTTFRPPYLPVSFALLAGRDRGALFDPVRVTPIHPAHVAAGAVFEDVGQWKRPRFFPREGEDMDAAVRRECAAARESVAKMDATTLGKIDVQGPDAVEFLNRMYTNAFDSLAVGRCRYARHVQARRDGLRRRRRHARRRAAVRLHDDDRQRRARARVDGGVAADRVAGAARLADLGDRAVGDRRRRRARLARAARRADRRSRSTARASRSWRSARARSPASRRASAASASRASSPSR